jgi:hypothetical protein
VDKTVELWISVSWELKAAQMWIFRTRRAGFPANALILVQNIVAMLSCNYGNLLVKPFDSA